MLEENALAPRQEHRIWLPRDYEKFLKFSSDVGITQLMLFCDIFYVADVVGEIRLIANFLTFSDVDVFIWQHCEQFCKRAYYYLGMPRTNIELRIDNAPHISFPMSFALKKTW